MGLMAENAADNAADSASGLLVMTLARNHDLVIGPAGLALQQLALVQALLVRSSRRTAHVRWSRPFARGRDALHDLHVLQGKSLEGAVRAVLR